MLLDPTGENAFTIKAAGRKTQRLHAQDLNPIAFGGNRHRLGGVASDIESEYLVFPGH
jgi:hypothetical protein